MKPVQAAPSFPLLLLLLFFLLLGMTASSGSSAGDSREERLFAIHTTTSVTKLTTVTVTGLSTCLSTATGSCLGRKRRMAMPSALNLEVLLGDSEADLAGSRTDSFEAAQPLFAGNTEEGGNRRKQRELTVWSTAYTTITITSTSILASTTVTASALCLVSGISQTCFS